MNAFWNTESNINVNFLLPFVIFNSCFSFLITTFCDFSKNIGSMAVSFQCMTKSTTIKK